MLYKLPLQSIEPQRVQLSMSMSILHGTTWLRKDSPFRHPASCR